MDRRLGTGFEHVDDDHAAAAGRTCGFVWLRLIDGISRLDIGQRTVVLSSQETVCPGDIVGAVAIGEQAVMADAVEAFGKDVDQEAPDELVDR